MTMHTVILWCCVVVVVSSCKILSEFGSVLFCITTRYLSQSTSSWRL